MTTILMMEMTMLTTMMRPAPVAVATNAPATEPLRPSAVAAAGAVSFLICGSTKTGLSRLLGSVSSYFIQNATCPVIVVRDQGNL